MTTLQVNVRRKLGLVERGIFGGFVEHLGRCIYGGIFDEGSPLSDERGYRSDVLDLLKQMKINVVRWPGGNFVSNYHWRDGVGPREGRPTRAEVAWGGLESNRFGTNEFIDYCRQLGAEPYICLNMGTGTLEEALAWVEYCNSDRPTELVRQRKKQGSPEPHGVHYWALGNEMYGEGQVGSLSAQEYVAEAKRWARAIKLVDPTVKLVSCGKNGWSNWDMHVIDQLASLVDMHSVHIYTGSEDYWTNVLAPHNAERAIEVTSAALRRAAYKQRLPRPPTIAYDEWNVWFRAMTGGLEERYNVSDALAVGTYLNIFVRNCRWVKMANLAQLVNAIAPIVTTPTEATVQPIFYPFLWHSQGHLDAAVDVYVDGPFVDPPSEHLSRWPHRVNDLAPFNLVDAAATIDLASSKLAVTLVNRSEQPEPLEVQLGGSEFRGTVGIRTLTAGSGAAADALVDPVTLDAGEEATKGERVSMVLPPKSFTLLDAGLRGS
jgi:alpha-L-arabinofuranosidase